MWPLSSVERPWALGRFNRALLLGGTLGFATLAPWGPMAPMALSRSTAMKCEEAPIFHTDKEPYQLYNMFRHKISMYI